MTTPPVNQHKQMVWFPDTSALVTMAIHAPLQQVVREALSAHRRVLLAAVVAELERLAKLSIHKLMHLMIKQRKITAVQAFRFAEVLEKAGRARDYTVEELSSGRLGRVGQP